MSEMRCAFVARRNARAARSPAVVLCPQQQRPSGNSPRAVTSPAGSVKKARNLLKKMRIPTLQCPQCRVNSAYRLGSIPQKKWVSGVSSTLTPDQSYQGGPVVCIICQRDPSHKSKHVNRTSFRKGPDPRRYVFTTADRQKGFRSFMRHLVLHRPVHV